MWAKECPADVLTHPDFDSLFFRLQSALDSVEPGDTISIQSGIYFEDLKTRVGGNWYGVASLRTGALKAPMLREGQERLRGQLGNLLLFSS